MRHLSDYAMLGFAAGLMSGSGFCAMPLFALAVQVPRKLSTMRHFTWHAELLPHTEQVIFHKSNMFGNVERHIVDIRNLEKIGSDECETPLMWTINMFDPDMIFRDTASREIFVFDKFGAWNQEAIEHKLLY